MSRRTRLRRTCIRSGHRPTPTRLRSSLGKDNTSSSGNGVHCAILRRSIRTTKLFRPVISRPRQVTEQSTPFSILGLALMRELGGGVSVHADTIRFRHLKVFGTEAHSHITEASPPLEDWFDARRLRND